MDDRREKLSSLSDMPFAQADAFESLLELFKAIGIIFTSYVVM
jgi:hypothetical protein